MRSETTLTTTDSWEGRNGAVGNQSQKKGAKKIKNLFGKHPARKINENLQIRESFDEFPEVHFQFLGMNPRLISK